MINKPVTSLWLTNSVQRQSNKYGNMYTRSFKLNIKLTDGRGKSKGGKMKNRASREQKEKGRRRFSEKTKLKAK